MLAKKNIFLLLILCLMSTMVVQAQEFVETAFEDAQAESELDPICEETESLEATMEPGQSLESDFTEGLLPSLEGDTTSEAAPEDLEVPMAEASEEAFGDSVFETEEADAQADSGSPVPLFASALNEADESEDFSADETVGKSQTLDIGDYKYYIVDGNASISKYNGKDSVVTIPTSFSYGGLTYKVRQVNNFAFENCSSLQNLVIPDGITSIGYGAFRNCTSLSNITIDTNLADCSSYNSYNGVKYINGSRKDPVYAYTSPFYNVGANSSSLTVTFGEHVKHVCAYLFATGASEGDMCYAHVTKVVIGKNVERIGNCAFYHCYDLTEVVIGEKVTNIGDYSFSNDKHLSSITWGQSLREIESYAFYNCDQLASINIPEKVTTLGSFAFETCEGLTSIVLPSTLCRMDDSSPKTPFFQGVSSYCTKKVYPLCPRPSGLWQRGYTLILLHGIEMKGAGLNPF